MDYLAFTAVVLGSFAALQTWLIRSGRMPGPAWRTLLVLALLLRVGWAIADVAAVRERRRIEQMVEGFAPTYAQEMQRLGHARLPLDAAPDDPAYLAMVDAEIRWLRVNPAIADVYTLRKRPDGANAFVVDSETDYDRDGDFSDERESRTAIGEVYDKPIPALERAFAGESAFTPETYGDRWGDWVSAFVPLRDDAGRVEAVLGVDYPAARWDEAARAGRLTVIGIFGTLALLVTAFSTVVALLRADLDARTHAEATVRELNAGLERRVGERTVQLEAANAALRQEIVEREDAQARLQALHEELVAASRKAGMAEIASNVLHNVGNVLNSVNVSSRVIAERVRESKLGGLARVTALLHDHRADLASFLADDPRGRQVPEYLGALSGHLEQEQTALLAELETLRKHLRHVKEVVSAQQRHARGPGRVEPLVLAELVEDALQMAAPSLARRGIALERDFAPVPPALGDEHKVLQILVNLLRNAGDALAAAATDDRRLVVRLRTAGDGAVTLAVVDNGVGIPPETLPRVFEHGFTTKAGGHGFGLHASALAAAEMRGSLAVSSDGAGRGATLTLTLPSQPGLAPTADGARA